MSVNRTRSIREWFYRRIWRDQYTFGNRILVILVLITIAVAAGTIGYMVIEGWGLHDALFMTVTTMSTVGYGEVHPLTIAGERYTVLLIFVGVGLLAYAFSTIADFIVAGELRGFIHRRRMQGMIDSMDGHYIICGYGRVGRQLAETLRQNQIAIVVVEREPQLIAFLDEEKTSYVQGDATLDATLRQAGIERARGICTCLPNDADNLFTVLTARMLKPNLYIISRANAEENEEKFKVAGANHTINPYTIAGARMATQLLHPGVVEFVDVAMRRGGLDLRIEEFSLMAHSPLVGRCYGELAIRSSTGVNVLAVRSQEGELVTNPADTLCLAAGDRLIGLGTEMQLAALGALVKNEREGEG